MNFRFAADIPPVEAEEEALFEPPGTDFKNVHAKQIAPAARRRGGYLKQAFVESASLSTLKTMFLVVSEPEGMIKLIIFSTSGWACSTMMSNDMVWSTMRSHTKTFSRSRSRSISAGESRIAAFVVVVVVVNAAWTDEVGFNDEEEEACEVAVGTGFRCWSGKEDGGRAAVAPLVVVVALFPPGGNEESEVDAEEEVPKEGVAVEEAMGVVRVFSSPIVVRGGGR